MKKLSTAFFRPDAGADAVAGECSRAFGDGGTAGRAEGKKGFR